MEGPYGRFLRSSIHYYCLVSWSGLFLWQSSKPPKVYLVVYFLGNAEKPRHYGGRENLEKTRSRWCLLFDRENVRVFCVYFDTSERAIVDTFCYNRLTV